MRRSFARRLPENLSSLGTLAEVKSVSRKPDGSADVVVEGVSRVGIEAVLTVRKPFQVRIVEIEEEETPGSSLGLMRHATALAHRRPGPLAD